MIGEKIRNLRKQAGITMKQLGIAIGLSESAIGLYENNKRSPDYETLSKIAEYFNVSVLYLLGEGIFKQKELIIELREPLTQVLGELTGDEMAAFSKTLSNEQFIMGLSTLISKIDFNDETGELTVYYYLDPNADQVIICDNKSDEPTELNKPLNLLYSKSEQAHIEKYRTLDERGKTNVDNLLETEYQYILKQKEGLQQENPPVKQMGKKAKEIVQDNKIGVGHMDTEFALDEIVSQSKKGFNNVVSVSKKEV